jgi:hypothetical protein
MAAAMSGANTPVNKTQLRNRQASDLRYRLLPMPVAGFLGCPRIVKKSFATAFIHEGALQASVTDWNGLGAVQQQGAATALSNTDPM